MAHSDEIYREHFNRIYDQTYESIKKYIAVKCSDIDEIPDILQETYLEYYRLVLRHGVQYAADPEAVLFKIAKRKIYRYYSFREKLMQLTPLFRTNPDGEEYCVADEMIAAAYDEQALDAIEARRLWESISKYPADIRKILYLYFNCELSLPQIAQAMNLTLSNVKNKLYRTLTELRKKEQNNG